jgi:hypothetical protein
MAVEVQGQRFDQTGNDTSKASSPDQLSEFRRNRQKKYVAARRGVSTKVGHLRHLSQTTYGKRCTPETKALSSKVKGADHQVRPHSYNPTGIQSRNLQQRYENVYRSSLIQRSPTAKAVTGIFAMDRNQNSPRLDF